MRQRKPIIVALLIVLVVSLVASIGGVAQRVAERGDASGSVSAPGIGEKGNGKVIGGNLIDDVSYQARWRSLVAILDSRRAGSGNDQQYCGGVLVTSTIVVTAAHCANAVPVASMRVLTGTDYLDSTWEGQLLKVQSSAVNPEYRSGQAYLGGDIAVLKLATPSTAPTTQIVGPGEDSLWGNGAGITHDGTRGPWIAGWGDTLPGDTQYFPSFPFHVGIPIYSDSGCTAKLGVAFNATKMMCAGVLAVNGQGNKGGCSGDSGGPIMAMSGTTPRVIGVVSFGPAKCDGAFPEGYTKVAAYRTWLAAQGVPISTGTATVTGGGATAQPTVATGPAVTLTFPNNNLTVKKIDSETDLRWTVRDGLTAGDLILFQSGKQIMRRSVAGAVGVTVPNRYFPAGKVSWCVTALDATTKAQVDRVCRSITQRADHLAVVKGVNFRGYKASGNGQLVSNAKLVKVKITLRVGGRVIGTSTKTIRPKTGGAVTTFSFATKWNNRSASAIQATVVVSGGGVSETFRNTLR